ncbi:Uncharacterized protein PCOAH_00051550 [Plasmodium coatneyi]|uniref:WD repeat-containing protein n=1 Tax=Plasmodium coatneyi TaxID=208452 RepID=A0A1B1E840_9APIC|nr:Uncharacterized protein PCOAH_00051550 [Plasmodium coatneyi]ANQ11171.1 Uncharacterized protein PCOAH_00051550 [Plasmodium coatneyi]
MAEDWKNTILQRMKRRNVAQSQRYEPVLTSYNALVDEKNKLTAIIASFTSENVFMLNGKHSSISLSSRENSIPNILNQFYAQREDYDGDNVTHRNMSLSLASANDATTDGSPGGAATPSGDIVKTEDRLTNGVSKRELLQVIKEKAKADEMILLLKNNINEKKKILNNLNKQNKTLNDALVKKEQQLNEKKEKLCNLQNVICRQKKDIKLYASCNVSLKRKIKLSQKKNQKVIHEFDAIRLSYFKIWKEAFQLKTCKKNLQKEYFTIRSELLQKKIENEKLLQCLLKIKKAYRRQLIKMHTYMRQRKDNYTNLSGKSQTHRQRFSKKHKFFLTLYWDKLHYMHSCGEPPSADSHHSHRKSNIFAKRKNNLLAIPGRSSHGEEMPHEEKSQWGGNAPAPEAPHAIGKNKYSVLRDDVEVTNNKTSPFQNGGENHNQVGATNLRNNYRAKGTYQTASNDPTQFFNDGLRRHRLYKIKARLNVHTSSSVLCFSPFPGAYPQGDSHKYVKAEWAEKQRRYTSDRENQLNASGLTNRGENETSPIYYNSNFDSDVSMVSSVDMDGSYGDYSEWRDPDPVSLREISVPHPTDEPLHNALVTCAEDGSISFVKIKKDKLTCIKRFQITDQKIAANNVCVHPAGKQSILSLRNNAICLFNNESSEIEKWYHSHEEKITSINFLHHFSYSDELPLNGGSPGESPFFYSTSLDKTVKFFHVERGSFYSSLHLNDAITCSCKSNKQPLVLIGTRSGSVICYDVRVHNKGVTQAALYQKNILDDEISGVSFSPDDRLIAIQSIRGKTKLINTNKINFFQCLENPDFLKKESPTCAPVFSPDGNDLICTFPYALIAHNVVTHSYVTVVNDELGQINGAQYLPGGNLCTIHADGNVAIW